MKTAILSIALIITSFLAGGCAVEGPSWQQAEVLDGKAVVYIYRPYSILGAAIVPSVNCGESSIAVGPGGYHAFHVDAGAASCNSYSEVSSVVNFDVNSGQEYYVKEEMDWGILVAHVHLSLEDAQTARSEIQACARQ
jgi:hypothetical protein